MAGTQGQGVVSKAKEQPQQDFLPDPGRCGAGPEDLRYSPRHRTSQQGSPAGRVGTPPGLPPSSRAGAHVSRAVTPGHCPHGPAVTREGSRIPRGGAPNGSREGGAGAVPPSRLQEDTAGLCRTRTWSAGTRLCWASQKSRSRRHRGQQRRRRRSPMRQSPSWARVMATFTW